MEKLLLLVFSQLCFIWQLSFLHSLLNATLQKGIELDPRSGAVRLQTEQDKGLAGCRSSKQARTLDASGFRWCRGHRDQIV
ncbi:hypothetical protein, partial [Parasynechococcus sp.]|uniref:hypothetical protein n=1 Tax=Parasynechococcus sp. TaxID=3101203 RepID=UPI003703DE4D